MEDYTHLGVDGKEHGMGHTNNDWTLQDHKRGLQHIQAIKPGELKRLGLVTEEKYKTFPVPHFRLFYKQLSNKENRVLPFRVNGKIENRNLFEAACVMDMNMTSMCIYNKHAYLNMFTYNMHDQLIQDKYFLQVSIENLYSRKKGYGSKLLQHVVNVAKKNNVVLTAWCDNEQLRDYYVEHGFTYEYRAIQTGHYFLTCNLKE